MSTPMLNQAAPAGRSDVIDAGKAQPQASEKAGCCSTAEQAACCEPAVKPSCCGDAPAGGCGCR